MCSMSGTIVAVGRSVSSVLLSESSDVDDLLCIGKGGRRLDDVDGGR